MYCLHCLSYCIVVCWLNITYNILFLQYLSLLNIYGRHNIILCWIQNQINANLQSILANICFWKIPNQYPYNQIHSLGAFVYFSFISSIFKSRASLQLENIILRKQIDILMRKQKRPLVHNRDRLFFVLISKLYTDWKKAFLLFQPDCHQYSGIIAFHIFNIVGTCLPLW